MTVQDADRVAYVAHSARGQTRANGVTPYIEHPRRVAKLTREFSDCFTHSFEEIETRVVAALLHDVLEDTKLTSGHLLMLGVNRRQLDIIERLTKPSDGPAPKSYYEGIAEHKGALVVKCADRCANLEDALAELLPDAPESPRRWARYVEKTYADVLPMYAGKYPNLHSQLKKRLLAIEEALPAALERRAKIVEQKRAAANSLVGASDRAVESVRKLHVSEVAWGTLYCNHCKHLYPCETIRALGVSA